MMAKASGPDVVLVVVSIVAAVFAGWSALSSHRSAGSAKRSERSSESSAASAAEAVELERDRVRRELTPRIEVTYEGSPGLGNLELVWFANKGPRDYTSVTFRFVELPIDSPIAGFSRRREIVTEGEIGPLAIGERNSLILQRHGEDEGEGILYLILICRNDQDTWTIPAQVEIPGVPTTPNIF